MLYLDLHLESSCFNIGPEGSLARRQPPQNIHGAPKKKVVGPAIFENKTSPARAPDEAKPKGILIFVGAYVLTPNWTNLENRATPKNSLFSGRPGCDRAWPPF